jgi:succinate-semialdehyde dehydrogenase / glutarate-semialdehyde dehydrogenase
MIQTLNPYTEIVEQTFSEISDQEVKVRLQKVHTTYQTWKLTTLETRIKLMMKLAEVLKQDRQAYGALITTEMGCPISQTIAEIEKSAIIAELMGQQAKEFLQPKHIKTDATESYISYEPLGIVFHIAPWNYPFYLALRPVIAAILAGNCVVLKHASNVPQTALALEEVFKKAGFPDGVFETLLISSSQTEAIINDDRVVMVTLIGSDKAGAAVGALAGKAIKKTVMELGGSDPMIVCADADIDEVVKAAAYSRLRNSGQSCNAAKRFIVHQSVYDEFVTKLKEEFETEVIGNPMEKATTFGPMATESSIVDLQLQVDNSVKMGAKLVLGGSRLEKTGYYYPPTIVTNVTTEMPIMSEEVFGPVAPVYSFNTVDEAIEVANNSPYGLGASIWTKDVEFGKTILPKIEAGNVYLNRVVRGNPKLPFGGIKKTGFGREFGEHGLYEFVNIKSVVVN